MMTAQDRCAESPQCETKSICSPMHRNSSDCRAALAGGNFKNLSRLLVLPPFFCAPQRGVNRLLMLCVRIIPVAPPRKMESDIETTLHTLAVHVHAVQEGDEELVRVLLLVPGQVVRMRPHRVEQVVRRVRLDLPAEELYMGKSEGDGRRRGFQRQGGRGICHFGFASSPADKHRKSVVARQTQENRSGKNVCTPPHHLRTKRIRHTCLPNPTNT